MGKMEYTDNSKPFLTKLEREVENALDHTGDFFAQTIQDQMPGAGAKVIEGTGGDTGVRARFIPSNPGSPPGVRTVAGLKSRISSQKAGRLRRAVGTNVNYAIHLEYGTYKMPARPFMSPGYEAAKKPGLRVFINNLKKGMK